MNAQERTLLVEFLEQLTAAQAGPKDAEADALIKGACARQPDACYLLAQRALQLEQALDITQAELNRLKTAAAASPEAGGFLGGANAWGRSSANTTPAGGPVQRPPAELAGSAKGQAPAQPTQRFGSGMLGNVAATAAGVVAGSFLFQGVQNLLGRSGTEAPWDAAGAQPAGRDALAAADTPRETPADEGQEMADWDPGGDAGGDDIDFA